MFRVSLARRGPKVRWSNGLRRLSSCDGGGESSAAGWLGLLVVALGGGFGGSWLYGRWRESSKIKDQSPAKGIVT